MKRYFILYSNCIIVKGYKRSILCDFLRQSVQAIPNDLEAILKEKNKIDLNIINKIYSEIDFNIIKNYFDFLVDEDYGYYTDVNSNIDFSNYQKKYLMPFKLTNIIIDFDNFNLKYLESIIKNITVLRIRNVEFRFFDISLSLNDLIKLHDLINYTNVNFISLVLKYENFENVDVPDYSLFRFDQIIFYDCKFDEIKQFNQTLVNYCSKSLNKKSCGNVAYSYFSVTNESFTESLNHNSCLHKKISIDVDGNIRNCPSMPQSFGNIKNTTLEEALNHPDFKKYWNVTKDMIAVCKDCEFRHICTDCRAYTERTHFEGNIDLSKPLKCGYNPYTNEWAEWSTNPLKEKAIEYYGMQELVKKEDN